MIPNVYVAATRQNEGKTFTSLGLLNAMNDYFKNVGYIKPVGQQVKLIDGHNVDKDAQLMEEIFHIGKSLTDMSPIAIPSGFTEEYILNGNPEDLRNKIRESYDRVSEGKDFMVVEGTGHAGVGSVFDLCNASVANMLNAPVVIVTGGGIGRPIDEILLNKALFDNKGVKVIGVIINKVLQAKYEKINKFVRLGFEKRGIDVIGVVPFHPILASPKIKQLLDEIKGELLCGEEGLNEAVTKILVGAMPAHTAIEYFEDADLLITPGNREDLILAAISGQISGLSKSYRLKGIILTGGIMPNKTVLQLVEQVHIPVILVNTHTYETAQRINKLMVKVRPEDHEKITKIKELVKEYVDIEMLIDKIKEFHSIS